MTVQHALARAVVLLLLCALLQALLPGYLLGAVDVVPLSLVLGTTVAATLARGRSMLPAALAGVLLGAWWAGDGLATAFAEAAIVGAQSLLAAALVWRSGDANALALDGGRRLKRVVLEAAPAAALLGALLHAAADMLIGGLHVPTRHLLATLAGRGVADWAGIVVVVAIALCWLGRPAHEWRPRRRVVALPLLLLTALVLPGIDQVARRDEARLDARFQRSSADRQWRVQQVLNQSLDALALAHGALVAADATGQPLPEAAFDAQAIAWERRLPGLVAAGWIGPDGSAGRAVGHQLRLDAPRGAAARAVSALRSGAPSPEIARALLPLWGTERPTALPLAHSGDDTLMLLVRGMAGVGASAPRLVYVVVDTERLVEAALPAADDPNLVACLVDADRPQVPDAKRRPVGAGGFVELPAGSRRLAGAASCAAGGLGRPSRSHADRVLLADRPLQLVVAEPAAADDRLFTAAWLLALPAAAGGAMLASLLLLLSGRLARIEERVQERTAQLQRAIDRHRQSETALAHTEQRFRAIFDSVPIGVTLVDVDGRLRMVNPAFCTLMASGTEQLLGRALADFQLPDVAQDDGTAEALAGVQARRQRYLSADGRVVHVAARLHTLKDATGATVATIGALQDLTPVLRLREAERAREEAQAARQAQNRFVAGLSHTLRGPLATIAGFAQALAEGDALPESLRQRSLAQIRSLGHKLLEMVGDVRDLSRLDAGDLPLTLEPVALPDAAQEAIDGVEDSARRAGVTLQMSLSPAAEWVQADTLRLRQVLGHLLANAVRYNRRGGRVELRARPGGVGDVLIEVHDSGLGLDAEQLRTLFNPFERPHRPAAAAPGAEPDDEGGGAGAGLGLALSLRLARRMQGELSATSTVGEGSVFTLRLPRATANAPRSSEGASTPLPAPRHSVGRVLHIDPDLKRREAVAAILAQRPAMGLVVVDTAADALAQALEADLVLLAVDIAGGEAAALALLRELRADTRVRHTPVVMLLDSLNLAQIDRCLDAGAHQCLARPINAAALLAAVDQAVRLM